LFVLFWFCVFAVCIPDISVGQQGSTCEEGAHAGAYLQVKNKEKKQQKAKLPQNA
jgi:hypothetical protein